MAKKFKNKAIITCAVTGAMHTPTMSDYLPITPEEIAKESLAAAKAGASIIHLHARDPKTGEPTGSPEVFEQFLPVIKERTDAVINITTGGSPTMATRNKDFASVYRKVMTMKKRVEDKKSKTTEISSAGAIGAADDEDAEKVSAQKAS